MSVQQWRVQHKALINERLESVRAQRDGVLFRDKKSIQHVSIFKHQGMVYMYFGGTDSDVIQSRMLLDSPLYLVAPYSQLVMTAAAICPAPKRIYMVGLGGGRIPMVLRHLLPEASILCSELDFVVANVAEQYFGFIPDEKLRVHVGDGRACLERQDPSQPFDLIFLDAFGDSSDGPLSFATSEFYTICQQRLSPDGVVVINLLPGDTHLDQKKATVLASFPYVYLLKDIERGNRVLFGCKSSQSRAAILERAKLFDAEVALGFSLYAQTERLENISAVSLQATHSPQTELLKDKGVVISSAAKPSRNDVCYCGSGKKYKKCHGK